MAMTRQERRTARMEDSIRTKYTILLYRGALASKEQVADLSARVAELERLHAEESDDEAKTASA